MENKDLVRHARTQSLSPMCLILEVVGQRATYKYTSANKSKRKKMKFRIKTKKVAHRSAKKIYPRKQLKIAKHKFDKVN